MIIISYLAALSAEGFTAIFGWVSKSSYTSLKENHKNKHLSNIFGKAHNKNGCCKLYIGVFSPISNNDIYPDDHTELIKNEITGRNRNEQIIVPLYSDVIVKDDYDAASKIIYILNTNKYGYIKMVDDTDQENHDKSSLSISIGGPRSNQMTKHITKIVEKYININDRDHDRSKWTYEVNGKTYIPDNNISFFYIIKINMFDENIDHTYISIAGDTSESTLSASNYICSETHIKKLSETFGEKNFLVFAKIDNISGKPVETILDKIEIKL